MTIEQLRQQCHEIIEQIEDERSLSALLTLAESLKRHYGDPIADYDADLTKPEDFVSIDNVEEESSPKGQAIPEWAKPLTPEESLKGLREGVAQYESGDYITLEALDKEVDS